KNSQKVNNHELKNLSKTDFSLKDEKLNTLLNEAYFEIGRLNGLLEMLSHKDILLSPLLIMEAVKSSNVENINSTVLEQLQVKVKGRKVLSSEQKQTENYRLALLAGFDYLNQKNSFDLDLIKLIQKILEPNLTGIRDIQKVVIANTATSEIIWEPPLGKKKILKLLENWLEIANENSLDDLVKVCILHSQFEAIHPFVDGNGRTGRILITLYLVFKKYLNYPSLYLSDYILQTRTYYYLHLQESQQNQNHLELVKYLLKGIATKAKSG
ncbi:MAG: Fic family protein, partial [Dolichospermum sp.]